MRSEYGLSKIIGENVVSKSMFGFQNCPILGGFPCHITRKQQSKRKNNTDLE